MESGQVVSVYFARWQQSEQAVVRGDAIFKYPFSSALENLDC